MALELNLSIITENLPLLLKGAGITLEITALSVGLGLLIGMFVGVAKLSDNRLIRGLASVYVDCIRGTPLLVQIFLVYFALPQIIGHRIDPFVVPTLQKSSAPVFKASTKDRWKLPERSASTGFRPCVLGSCRRRLSASFRRSVTNSSPC